MPWGVLGKLALSGYGVSSSVLLFPDGIQHQHKPTFYSRSQKCIIWQTTASGRLTQRGGRRPSAATSPFVLQIINFWECGHKMWVYAAIVYTQVRGAHQITPYPNNSRVSRERPRVPGNSLHIGMELPGVIGFSEPPSP